MNDILIRLREPKVIDPARGMVRQASALECEAADEIERGMASAETLARYGLYYRNVLFRIVNGYPAPKSLAQMALDWTIHDDGCTEDMDCACELPPELESPPTQNCSEEKP